MATALVAMERTTSHLSFRAMERPLFKDFRAAVEVSEARTWLRSEVVDQVVEEAAVPEVKAGTRGLEGMETTLAARAEATAMRPGRLVNRQILALVEAEAVRAAARVSVSLAEPVVKVAPVARASSRWFTSRSDSFRTQTRSVEPGSNTHVFRETTD